MLTRLLCLILLYSLPIFSIAGPLATSASSNNGNKRKPAPTIKKSSCATCAPNAPGKSLGDRIDGLATLGRTTQIHPFLPVHRSAFEGVPVNFVSTATGHLAFALNDLGLPGSMPLVFQRVYSSERREDHGLGEGWSFFFDDRISIDGDAATLVSGDSSVIAFRADGPHGRFVLKTPEPLLHQSFELNDDTITEQLVGLTRIYKKLGPTFRLTRVTDRNGNSLTIDFDARVNINRIASRSGWLALEWSDNKDSRLLGVSDSAGRRVSFKQNGRLLRAATDVAGNAWTYDYSRAGLTSASDPQSRVLLSVRYDRSGRVVESADGAGAYSYEYASTSPTNVERTSVTDPLGVKTIFEHNERGEMVEVKEDGGPTLLQINHDSANRTTRLSTPQGNMNFNFDVQNRLTHSTLSDGSSRAYSYDARGQISSLTDNGRRTDYTRDANGNIVIASSSEPGQGYRAAYDARGRLKTFESDDGRKTTNEYDGAGNVTAFTTESIGRVKTERDRAGRITLQGFPSGLAVRYDRNARGAVARQSDNQGRSVTFEHDSSGALTGLIKPDASWIRAVRDHTGRIVALNSSTGKSRRFAYDSRGGLTDYTDPLGRHKRFNYDRRGRLNSITDDEGNRTTIERDENGAVKSIGRYTRDGWRYDYDRAGRLIAAGRSLWNQAGPFQSIGYNRSTALPGPAGPNLQGYDCLFGSDFDFDPWSQGLNSCWDPFGGFGGGGGCDPFDPLGFGFDPGNCYSFLGETPEQCAARQRQMCENSRTSCGAAAAGSAAAAMAACFVLTQVNPIAGAVCVTAVYFRLLADLTSCDLHDQNCRLSIPDRCRR